MIEDIWQSLSFRFRQKYINFMTKIPVMNMITCVILCGAASTASAQIGGNIQNPSPATSQYTTDAASRSLQSVKTYSRQISASEVYANPDDHDLNLEFAKQQVRKGEMLTAAAALERMLYANPNWHSARLFYAAILYRLDDQKAAIRELDLLKGRNLNTYQKETLTRYKTSFKMPPPRLTGAYNNGQTYVHNPADPIRAQVTIGFGADNNAGNALTDANFGFNNLGDVSASASGRVRATYRLSKTNDIILKSEVSGQLRRFETFSEADHALVDVRVGVSGKSSPTSRLAFDMNARRLNISGEKYLSQIGPQITVTEKISETIRGSVSLSGAYQDYSNLQAAPLENERDGVKLKADVGFLQKLSDRHRLKVSAGYDLKTAEIDAFAYHGPKASVEIVNAFDKNWQFKGQLSVRHLNYDGRLSGIGPDRKDNRVSARLAMAHNFKSGFSGSKRDMGIEAGVNYNKRASNVDVNDYENVGVDVRLILDF